MLQVKVTQPGRTQKSTVVVEGTITQAPKLHQSLVVKSENKVVYQTDPAEAITHHVKANSYTVKVGRHKVLVEVLGELPDEVVDPVADPVE